MEGRKVKDLNFCRPRNPPGAGKVSGYETLPVKTKYIRVLQKTEPIVAPLPTHTCMCIYIYIYNLNLSRTIIVFII